MKKATLFLPILVVMIGFMACGDADSASSGDGSMDGNTSHNSGNIASTIANDSISSDVIWGRWRPLNKPEQIWEFGKAGLSVFETEQALRTEDFEVTTENRCTAKKVEGKTYLVVKGAVTTCYGLRRLDQDSLFLDFLPFKPPLKFVRVK